VAAAPAAPAPAPAAPAAPDEAQPGSAPAASDSAPLVPTSDLGGSRQPATVKSSRQEPTDEALAAEEPTVRAAANGAVTIKDFEFAPTTVNVSVGDSVTWLNQGPTTHTATAKDGSFDSGNLAKGKSFSHKFTKAGTYSYFCKPHPFMTAKVVVAGAGSSGSSGSSGSGSGSAGASGSSGSSSSGSSSSGTLATTGVDLLPWALFGFSLLAFGASLRYRLTD
jgi:plastocyanin